MARSFAARFVYFVLCLHAVPNGKEYVLPVVAESDRFRHILWAIQEQYPSYQYVEMAEWVTGPFTATVLQFPQSAAVAA